MRVGDEHRAGVAGRGRGELVAVDEGDAGLDGVDAEACVDQVEEAHRRLHVADDAGVGPQRANRAFQDQGRAGDRVEDSTVPDRRVDQPFGDLGVHVVERVGLLVHLVEGHRIGDQRRRRMSGGAHETMGDLGDEVECVLRDVLGAAGAEAHHDDRRRAHSVTSATTEALDGSQRPKRLST